MSRDKGGGLEGSQGLACREKREAEAEHQQHPLLSPNGHAHHPRPYLHSHKFPKGGAASVSFTFVLPEHSAAPEVLGKF